MAVQPLTHKHKPCVSVLIAAYQSGSLLQMAVGSIIAQDWPNLEIIVCDDGTPGFEFSSVEQQLRDGGRPWRLIHQNENVGTVRNLNSGLHQCCGTWGLILAADDVLAASDTVTKLMDCAARSEKNFVLGYTELCDENLVSTGVRVPSERELAALRTPQTFFSLLCRDCFLPSSGNLYRIEFLRELCFFDENYRLIEDWPLFLKLARLGQLPELSGTVSVLRRSGGISQRGHIRNQVYQRDLVTTLKREVLPYLDYLPRGESEAIRQRCQDKIDIFFLRFELHGLREKLGWVVGHMGLVLRKIQEKIGGSK